MALPVRVLVVDGSDIAKAGLAKILRAEALVHVVGFAATRAAAHELIEDLNPDVVVVRDRLSDTSGFVLTAEIHASSPERALVVLLTEVTERGVREAMTSGARAVIHLETSEEDVRSAIRLAARQMLVLDPLAADHVVDWVRRAAGSATETLSSREYEVVRHITEGADTTAIAQALGLTPNTVRTYIRRALEKLGCSTRAEAAAKLSRSVKPS